MASRVIDEDKHHTIHISSNTPPQSLPSLFTETMLDPTTQLPLNHFQTFKPTRHATDHHTSPNMSFENRPKTESNQNHINWNVGQVQFRAKHDQEDESGVVSPPLWKSNPPTSHPQINNYRNLSPNSRAQVIARGQRELMEMVKHMPESCYELSLKDLVENNRIGSQSLEEEEEEKCLVELKSFEVDEKVKVIKRQGSMAGDNRGKMMRSTSHDNGGLLLKMVLPFSLGSKKKKKSTSSGPCAKVSPKPDQKADQATEKSRKGVDKEWWKKRFSASSESESGVFSSNSGSSGSSRGSSRRSNSNSHRRSGCTPGCWFFLSKRNKRSTE